VPRCLARLLLLLANFGKEARPEPIIQFLHLEQTYTTLAENKEWMAVHIDKMINGGGLIRPDFRAYFAGTAYRGF
jgi:hypothetical protein